jgi:nucleotide-binding universal stress UspA family protein
MFETVIWATDGSQNADVALEVAKPIARENAALLLIVHVVQRFATEGGLAVHADEDKVRAKLERLVEELSAEGLDVRLELANHIGPQAAHEIADAARQAGADLIVMGTRGHAAIPGLLLGSVTLRLLHIAPCPVLAVPAIEQDGSRRDT